jgi:hypothetical protein
VARRIGSSCRFFASKLTVWSVESRQGIGLAVVVAVAIARLVVVVLCDVLDIAERILRLVAVVEVEVEVVEVEIVEVVVVTRKEKKVEMFGGDDMTDVDKVELAACSLRQVTTTQVIILLTTATISLTPSQVANRS